MSSDESLSRLIELIRRILAQTTDPEEQESRLQQEVSPEEFPKALFLMKQIRLLERQCVDPSDSTRPDEGDEEIWTPVAIGDEFGGYRPKREIARTKSSILTICVSRHGNFTSVVKFPVPGSERDRRMTDQRLKFTRTLAESQALYGFYHPNVIRIFNSGYLRVRDNQLVPFVAMEQVVDAVSLHDWRMARKGNLTREEIAAIISVLCDAIGACHRTGIMHMDLSANNIVIQGGRSSRADSVTIKVIDFGAAAIEQVDLEISTKNYSSPARLESDHTPNPRDDIFSLGCVLYFLYMGQQPDLDEDRARFHFENWHDHNLRDICSKAVASSEPDRFVSTHELSESTLAWANDEPIPHLGRAYSWWYREKLLWKRGYKYNNIADHRQIIGRTAAVMAVAAIATGIWHIVQVASGIDPNTAYIWAINSFNAFCFLVVALCGSSIRFNTASFKILEPLLAITIACLCLQTFISPRIYMSYPTWQEQNQTALSALLMVSIANISYGALSPEWRAARWVGWTTLLMTFFLRPLFESRYSSVAMPIVLLSTEALACLAFASSIVTKPHDNLPSA